MECSRCNTPYTDSQEFCHHCGMVFIAPGIESQVEHYRLQERIGQGHAGTVYRGLDATADQEVAVKVLHRHVLEDTSFMEQLRHNSSKYEQISHPNIVPLLGIHENSHVTAIVTELLQGCTLQQYLDYREPGWPEIHYIALGILDALQAMRRQGVKHGNIKPSNIFLCDDGNIRLTDFALGKANLSTEHTSPSTPGHSTTTREENYAFGLILYRLATGHWPFRGEHHADDIFNVSGGWMDRFLKDIPLPRSVNPDIPDCLAEAISTLLSPDPQKHPESLSDIGEMLAPLGTPVLPVAPEDGEGHAQFSYIPRLRKETHQQNEQLDEEEAKLDASGVPVHSLLWVFKIASENASGGVPLDLCTPPPIEPHVLQRLRHAIEKVPPLPEVWHQVLAIFDDPSSSPRDLARIIEHDPVLVAQILRMANSAAYLPSSGRPISNIAQAITRIGMGPTRTMLLQNATPALGGVEAASKPDMLRVWFHSQAISHFSHFLARYTKGLDRRAASLFGLLHDIGKLIMLHTEDEQTMQKVRESIASGDSSLKAEWDVLGYTHIDAGTMLALHWNLPPKIHRLIFFHHHPCWHAPETWPSDVREQIMIVHMAHLVLQSMMNEDETGGVWSAEQRTHVESSEALLRHPIHLPVANIRIYSEMQQELLRLKRMFPTLYPDTEEDPTPETIN